MPAGTQPCSPNNGLSKIPSKELSDTVKISEKSDCFTRASRVDGGEKTKIKISDVC